MLKVIDSFIPSQWQANFHSYCSKALAISGVALMIIGFMAAAHVGCLTTVSAYWYCFELGALFCFVASCIKCCCCNSADPLPMDSPSEQPAQLPLSPPPIETRPPAPEKEKPLQEKIQTMSMSKLYQAATYDFKKKKNYSAAFLCYSAASEKGHVLSTFHAARLIEQGRVSNFDNEKALEYYEKAAGAGHIESLLTLAKKAYERNDFEAGNGWIERAATNDAFLKDYFNRNVQGQELDADLVFLKINVALLREIRRRKRGWERRFEKMSGEELFKKANAYAQKKNYNAAFLCFYAATEKGFFSASFSVARYIELERVSYFDKAKALKYYEKAADAGHIRSILFLAKKAYELNDLKAGDGWIERATSIDDSLQKLFNETIENRQLTLLKIDAALLREKKKKDFELLRENVLSAWT